MPPPPPQQFPGMPPPPQASALPVPTGLLRPSQAGRLGAGGAPKGESARHEEVAAAQREAAELLALLRPPSGAS